MTTSLRLALVVVTLSFLATLSWLVTGDQSDWSASVRDFGQRVESALAATDHASPRENRDEQSSRTEIGPAQSVAPDIHTTGDALPRRTSPPSETQRPREFFTADNAFRQPSTSEIQLTAGTVAEDFTTLRKTKNGIDLIVRNKDVGVAFDMLNSTGLIKIVALPSVKDRITLTLYDTTVEKALEAILKMRGYLARKEGDYTLVYTQADLEELDAEDGKIEVFTYKPQYISATDLTQVLTVHLSQKGKISSTRANQIGIAASADNAGGDGLAVDDVIVVQDMHSAIVRIKQIIDEIDIRPQQVLIEAVILKVSLDDDHRMGVNFALLDDGETHLTVVGNGSVINGATGFPPSTLVSATGKVQGGFASNDHGLKYGVINGDLAGFINLLETIGHTTVVASPKVPALNKQRAEIIVGSQLGYRTVTTTETAAVENVQFLDVGTQLRMRPFIQQDGFIRMELHPEESNGQVSETTGLPEKETTQVTTNLTIKSCQTIVIGGLIKEEQTRSIQQVPFLGSMPLVGRLFRNESTSISRTEIIVLITPRIIDEDEESAAAADEIERFSKRRDSLERSMPKHTRIALARQYYDRASACRDAGDLPNARKFVDLSLHFDPMHEPALKLWEELQSLPDDTAMTIDDNPVTGPAIESPEGIRLAPIESH
jgi:type IV pilus assembly protein PilQ